MILANYILDGVNASTCRQTIYRGIERADEKIHQHAGVKMTRRKEQTGIPLSSTSSALAAAGTTTAIADTVKIPEINNRAHQHRITRLRLL